MSSPVDDLQQLLKQLPGLGYRSAERIAMNLLVENPERMQPLIDALKEASMAVRRCTRCGNLSASEICPICQDLRRDLRAICVVERVQDLVALEKSGAWKGGYHVLHGRLSPIHKVGPENLNLASLFARVASGEVDELVLALSNDVEGEATCHYVIEQLPPGSPLKIKRIAFGLPSGGGVLYADPVTLKSALDGRRDYR